MATPPIDREALHAEMERARTEFHRLEAETEERLREGMPFPPGWDPFFAPYMTRADIYHYATEHFDFHRRQLTITTR